MNKTSEILIVAAEASSALYAQRILEEWKKRGQKIHGFGVGSREMEKQGFEILGRSEEMAVVGLQEVIAHWPLIKKTFKSLVEAARARKPKVALLLDYPEFNLRLAKELKSLGVKVVYYISPQVWAWRTGRVKTIRKVVDRMLVVFPFEVDFFSTHGVPVTFVGHPLLDELSEKYFDPFYRTEHRSRYGLKDDDVVLGLMPGSRKSEVKHHLKDQLKAASILRSRHPEVRTLLLIAPTLERLDFEEELSKIAFSVQVVKASPPDMIHLTDIVLCASGTATLMVGLLEKPMVIMYRMTPFTAFFAKKLVTKTPFFGMVNLIMKERIVPELFQEQAAPEFLALELEKYVTDRNYFLATTKNLNDLKNRLGRKGATERVVDVLAEYLS